MRLCLIGLITITASFAAWCEEGLTFEGVGIGTTEDDLKKAFPADRWHVQANFNDVHGPVYLESINDGLYFIEENLSPEQVAQRKQFTEYWVYVSDGRVYHVDYLRSFKQFWELEEFKKAAIDRLTAIFGQALKVGAKPKAIEDEDASAGDEDAAAGQDRVRELGEEIAHRLRNPAFTLDVGPLHIRYTTPALGPHEHEKAATAVLTIVDIDKAKASALARARDAQQNAENRKKAGF